MKKILVTTLVVLTLIAALSVMISAENLIDQSFPTTTGDIKWAFFESAGKLAYNNTDYAAGTLVIYGDGTAYDYESAIKYNNQNGYPWLAIKSKIKSIVFATPNLKSIQELGYMYGTYSEIYIPSSITSFENYHFAATYNLHTIKVAGVDYSEYGDAYIYDLRNIKTFGAETFSGVAKNVNENITVLLGKDTNYSFTDSTYFANNSTSTFTFVVYKDSNGETWANDLYTNVSSNKIADNIKIEYYSENLINQSFHTTTGDIKWAFFKTSGKLAYNNTEYAAGTLIIYGDGTAYGYSQTPTTDGSGYPWKDVLSEITAIVFDTPNLTTIQTLRYMRNYSELYIPAGVTTFTSSLFAGSRSLKSIKVAGVDYSEYSDTYIYDFRNIKSFNNYALDGVANSVEENITVLLGKDTYAYFTSTAGSFAGSSKSTFTFVVYKDSEGETFAKSLYENASLSSSIADNIKIEYYAEQEIKSAMMFEGYQVRTEKKNGLRGVFTFDKTVINKGMECVEYGTILATKANKEEHGIALTESNGEFVTANKRIIKVPVIENGELVGKCWSNDENKMKFAATIVNFEDNYQTPIYMCGYEIWEDSSGNTEIIYTEHYAADNEVYTPSICEVVVEFFANGILNASDEDDKKVLWGVLDNCRNEITATSTDYTIENNIIKHKSADVNVHTFTRSDSSVVAIITGSGVLKDVANMLYKTGVVPEVVVIDHGFTDIGNNCFTRPVWDYKPFKTIIYPDGIAWLGQTNFQGLSNLETVFKVHTSAEVGTADLSYIDEVYLPCLFNGSSNIKYIHLPTNFTNKDNVILTNEAFKNCTALKAIWCGNNSKPADGTADFTGTSITEVNSDTFTNVTGITNFIWGEAVSQ